MLSSPFHIEDINGYIFFSDNTTGVAGKPVKIRSNLFVDFLCAVDPRTHDGQTVIRDIERLTVLAKANTVQPLPVIPDQGNKTTKLHNERMDDVRAINNVMAGKQECSLVTKNLRVFYRIHQNAGDACPTVYIFDVHMFHRGTDNVGGIYDYNGRKLEKVAKPNLDGKLAVIGRAQDTVQDAMSAAVKSAGAGVTVFFSPKTVTGDLSISRNNRLTDSTQKVVDELTMVLRDNQKKSVAWLVEDEGASVLAHAVKRVGGTLEGHSFKFINAKANLPALMQELGKKKVQLTGDFMLYSNDNMALLAIAVQKDQLLKQLGELPGANNYEKISRRHLMQDLDRLGTNKSMQSFVSQQKDLRTKKITFVNALSAAVGQFK